MRIAASTRARGKLAEDRALAYLQQQGLSLVLRNYACRFGEIDLVMQERQVLVFVEVRSRRRPGFGGAAASVDKAKQQRLWRTAEHYLMCHGRPVQQGRPVQLPACRFDVVAIEGETLSWMQDAIFR